MSGYYHKSILLDSVQLTATQFTGTDNGFDLTQWQDFMFADELTFILDLQVESGLTAGSLGAKFQFAIPHKTGSYEWGQQRLVDYRPEDVTNRILERADFGAPMWTHQQTLPFTIQRTVIPPGIRCNLRLFTPVALAGGGYIQVSAVLIAKGK